jgi:hypothetical protein
MHLLNSMRVSVNRLETLEAIKKNAENHAKIVAEARAGYLKAAEKALTTRLKELRSGKRLDLGFTLAPPLDQSKVYRTIIKMLEMHQGETVDLDSSQVRAFVMDEWDWKRQFLLSNAAYSATALEAVGSAAED